ncbi:MAG: 4-alpha-glucanotransferase [Thermovirgaceae bacterium]
MDLSRSSGILLPLFSLPGPWFTGDLGEGANAFIDFLKRSGQSWWQVLPAGPTDFTTGNSPYSSPSAFAGNPLFVSPEDLVTRGYLAKEEISLEHTEDMRTRHSRYCDYLSSRKAKGKLFRKAWENFPPSGIEEEAFQTFCRDHAAWLEDYALFKTIKDNLGGKPWYEWPEDLRDRHTESLDAVRKEHRKELTYRKFLQFLFFSQWKSLKKRCAESGIGLIGDMPIYVSHDSADVWAERSLFCLDSLGIPTDSAGVPPDYFSETGQLWGNPLYRWEVHQNRGYDWWLKRLGHNLSLFDFVRVDHFRGFIDFWAVPTGEKTAERGRWERGPGKDFFGVLKTCFPELPLLAENLGTITPEVTEVMREFALPGMLVLLFAFGEGFGENPYAPHNHTREDFVYTGTHDNNTVRGWFEEELDPAGKELLARYLGHSPVKESVHRDLVRMALQSVARVSIVPLQDFLGLDARARLNTPSTTAGNWLWRALFEDLSDHLEREILSLTALTGRMRRDLRDHPDVVR